MGDQVREFYDELAGDYHLLFGDWRASVRRQGEVLDRLIRMELGDENHAILDAACGIGTQAIGVALMGHRVHATDLSPEAIRRATREAGSFGVKLTTGIADLRALAEDLAGVFDAVMACDNVLPHLMSDVELSAAVDGMALKLRSGGLLVASLRDYDALVRDRLPMDSFRVIGDDQERRITFQVWDWAEDGSSYRLDQFLLRQAAGSWRTDCYSVDYRALRRHELESALDAAGFDSIRWHTPDETEYYQPIVTARKP